MINDFFDRLFLEVIWDGSKLWTIDPTPALCLIAWDYGPKLCDIGWDHGPALCSIALDHDWALCII
jgi:hypothetical protein